MIEIEGVKVDIPLEDLTLRNKVFLIELEYDLSLWVGVAYNKTVHEALIELLKPLVASRYCAFQETAEAVKNSEYLSVSIVDRGHVFSAFDPIELFKHKYRTIEKLGTIYPNGHNFWGWELSYNRSGVRACISTKALNEVRKEMIKAKMPDKASTRGRKSIEVFQYKFFPKEQGAKSAWNLIKSYPSVSAAAKSIRKGSAGNISIACVDPTKTAYGYKWSHSPEAVFPSHKKN